MHVPTVDDRSGEVLSTGESQVEVQRLPLLRVMPQRLVLVRHGESEANLVQRAIKNGVISEYPLGFKDIPDREFHLSRLGCEQAHTTGQWLAKQYPEGFDRIYVSDHVRAKETAGLVCQAAGWHDVEIRIDPLLGERNWGRFPAAERELREQIMQLRKRDPLHVPMPDGETLLETRNRSRELLDRAAREFSGMRVLVFTHGEYIESIWAEIAHMHTEQQVEFFHSPAGDIKNCQVIEFASIDPHDTAEESNGKLRWVRSSCPQAGIEGQWGKIEKRKFSPQELLEQIERYPRLDFVLPNSDFGGQ